MGVAENIETVKRFYAAGPADDDSERLDFFAPDAVWHVPGDNPVSGAYHGVAAITEEIAARMQPLDGWQLEPRHIMGNVDLVCAVGHLSASRRGISVNTHGRTSFATMTRAELSRRGFIGDQARVDDLFRA